MSQGKDKNPLKRIEGHTYFYMDQTSGIIQYKDSRFKFSTKCRTIREAKKAAEAIIQTKLKNISLATAKRDVMKIDNPLISEIYFEMLEEKRIEVTEQTLSVWERSYHHGFGPFFTGKFAHVEDLTDQNLMKWKKWYLEDRGTRHAQKVVVHLIYFMRWLHKNKLLKELPDFEIIKNLPALVEKKAKREPPGRNLSISEDKKLLAAAAKHSTTAYLMVILGIRCGLRKESEALALEWSRVDFKAKAIKVWSKKNHNWRTMPVTDEVIEAFSMQQNFVKDCYGLWVKSVFPMKSLPNRPMSGQVFDKIWLEVKRASGITGRLRFHDLRHTFATRTAEYGMPPIVACEVLDMSLKIYQQTYCHPSEESVADMMAKMHKKTSKTGVKAK